MSAGVLTDDAKTFVVQSLAMWDSPSAVAAAVKKEFGFDITRQAVEAYDPTKRAGANLGDPWRALFTETREAFLADTAAIGVSHRSVRLRTLQRLAERAEATGNLVLTASLLEQAAKEVGGAFTNRRELSGPDGKPIETIAVPNLASLTEEERGFLRRRAERLLQESGGAAEGA